MTTLVGNGVAQRCFQPISQQLNGQFNHPFEDHTMTKEEHLAMHPIPYRNLGGGLHDNVFDEKAMNSFLQSSVLARLHCSKTARLTRGACVTIIEST